MSHLGTISLDIELDDRTVSVDVPPLEAAIIELFSQKGRHLFHSCMVHGFEAHCVSLRFMDRRRTQYGHN